MTVLWTLGTVELWNDEGVELHGVLAGPKRLALLVHLALATPRGFHRRDALLALLWPEFDEAHARGALRNTLHQLRRAIGAPVLRARGNAEVGVDDGRLWCDAIAFERALARSDFGEALRLYRGELLAGFHLCGVPVFERWLDERRARLRALAASAACAFAEQLAAAGDAERAGACARHAAGLVVADERALRRLITVLDGLGDRAGALHLYDDFARRLAADFDAEPSSETRALMQRVRTGGADAARHVGARPSASGEVRVPR